MKPAAIDLVVIVLHGVAAQLLHVAEVITLHAKMIVVTVTMTDAIVLAAEVQMIATVSEIVIEIATSRTLAIVKTVVKTVRTGMNAKVCN